MAEDGKARRKAEREQRLQAALRENLRRRKAQARSRAAETPGRAAAEDPGAPLSCERAED